MGGTTAESDPEKEKRPVGTSYHGRSETLAKRLLRQCGSGNTADRHATETANPGHGLLTGEPDAGEPPVRFGGRGAANQCGIPTPIASLGQRPRNLVRNENKG